MTSFSLKWKNIGEYTTKLSKVHAQLKTQLTLQFYKDANNLRNLMVMKIMRGPKSGKVYEKSDNISHVASAPGQPPANDTGNLAGSILIIKNGEQIVVSIGAYYASILEFGTSKIAERPFIRPSFMELKPKMEENIKELIKQALDDYENKGK